MKKVVLAGVFLVLVSAGVVYNWAHRSAEGSTGGAVLADGTASGQAHAGEARVNWVMVRDTREKAFSIQVPQSWKTYGGLFRFSAIDARMLVDMTSPDGMTNLRIGDSKIPQYRVPGPFLPRGRVWHLMPRALCLRPSMGRRDSAQCARNCS